MSDDQTMLEKIYMKYKIIKETAKVDTTLDKTKLDTAFNITMNLSKWIGDKTEWTRVQRDFEAKRKQTYRKLYEYYQTEYPLKISTKQEYELFIETDAGYVDIFNTCAVVKEIVMFYDSTIEILKIKQWELKSYIDWIKFQNGR